MKKQTWNENWYFWEMQDSFALLWDIPEDAVKVKLPHDAMLSHRAYAQSLLGGSSGYRDGGHFCYSKIVEPGSRLLPKYIVRFDGVYENASVYVNGNLIMRHPYGYTRFYADITPYLEPGRKNEIRVMTNNKAASSRWYTGGGLYRDVCLFTAEYPVYLVPDGIRIKTKSISAAHDHAQIEISAAVQNDTAKDREVRMEFDLGSQGSLCTDTVTIKAGSRKKISILADLKDPVIWSGDSPRLSSCGSTLLCADGNHWFAADSSETVFGIRRLGLDPANGLMVNGEPVKLRGACIHQDNGILGAAEFKDAASRRVRLLKQAGFNAIRMSHHPASDVLLEACDEAGVFVMNECFDAWTRNKTDYDYANYFEDWWERDLEAMVDSSYNHPSVIIYSLGNEIPEIGLEKGREICGMLQEKVKQLDDSRYTTVAINGVFSVGDIIPEIMADVLGDTGNESTSGNVNEFLSLMDQNIDKLVLHDKISERLGKAAKIVDISGYNYMVARYGKDAEEYPDRVIVGSETYPPDIGRIWDQVRKHPQIIGDFTWTGWDYIGEAGVGIPAYRFGEGGFGAKFPCQLAYAGDIDITGFRRPASYYREIVFGFRKEPYIVVGDPKHFQDRPIKTPWVLTDGTANWNYPGMEGKPVRIEIYSPGDEVELFLNGHSLGKKKLADTCAPKAEFETLYEPGVLRAVAGRDGKVIGEHILQTPQTNYHLCARIEDSLPELTYIEISCRDEEGILYQTCEEKIHVRTVGALESRLGTGNPKPDMNYTDTETSMWNGRALLTIRKENRDDEVSVTISNVKDTIQMTV